jgi:cobalt-zinc-cadmium resistance protein CzcA
MTPEEVESRITAHRAGDAGHPAPAHPALHLQVRAGRRHLDFEDGTDIYWARQQVGERLRRDGQPAPGASGGLAPITTPLGEMFMFTIEGRSPWPKRTLLDWTIRPALRTVPGVADVNSLGGEVRSFEMAPTRPPWPPAA